LRQHFTLIISNVLAKLILLLSAVEAMSTIEAMDQQRMYGMLWFLVLGTGCK